MVEAEERKMKERAKRVEQDQAKAKTEKQGKQNA